MLVASAAIGAAEVAATAAAGTATAAVAAAAPAIAAAPAAVTAAPAAVTAAPAAARRSFLARPGLVDQQRAIIVIEIVQGLDGLLGFLVVFHFHEPKAARAARFAIGDDLRAGHLPMSAKQLEQVVGSYRPGQIADVDILRHSKKKPFRAGATWAHRRR